MNIELKPIAESKVRQLGGDVCGVLVRTEGGVMAVSEHGRCTRLDAGVMGPVDGAQGGQAADVVAWECSGEPGLYDNITRSKGEADHNRKIGRTVRPLVYADTQPQPAVPEGWRECLAEMVQAMHDYEMSVDEDAPYRHRAMMDRAHALLSATPQPEGDEWLRLPGDANNHRCLLYTPSEQAEIEYRIVPAGFVKTVSDATHYMPLKPPTDLKRPQPPAGQEGA